MKTLVVDDDFVSRTKMHTIMFDFGDCEAVENGKAAIASFNKALEDGHPFDLIALDISMPDMDGTEVLLSLREIEYEKEIPEQQQVIIIMVTSHAHKDYIITCLKAGCNDYIVKPFDVETVNKKVVELNLKKQLAIDANKNKIEGNGPSMNFDDAFTLRLNNGNIKTLIVDDDFVSRAKMEAILESFGEFEIADSGHDAISSFNAALANEMPFDLITLDISMPGMDGMEVLFNIRQIERERCTPRQNQVKIIMVTSHSDSDHIIMCLQAGSNDYISKPFDFDAICISLEKIKSNVSGDYWEKNNSLFSSEKGP